jgi:CDP-glycerol glycerophosphotransferase (TagB/SpsB family)
MKAGMPGRKTPYPVQWAAGLLSVLLPRICPRDPFRVVLTSFHGDGYRGNTSVLFEKLCDHTFLRPVWLSRNSDLVHGLQAKFGKDRACLTHSIRGAKMLAGAGAVFMTHGTSDYPFMYLPRHAFRIQTYHGLPTKRGEYLRPDRDGPPNRLHQLVLAYRFRPITHFLSSSPLVTRLFSARFNLPETVFMDTGYPSADELINAGKPSPGFYGKLWPHAPRAGKLILYAPTFRRKSRTRWFPFDDLNLAGLASFLEEHDALLALRPHPNDGERLRHITGISNRFVIAGHTVVENVNLLVAGSDVIVTDYSGIYLEGLLRDIPAVFIPYDRQSYERGFPLPYDEVTPGPHVRTQAAFLKELEAALNRNDGFSDFREGVRSMFFSKTDGNAAGRVIAFLEDNLAATPGDVSADLVTG